MDAALLEPEQRAFEPNFCHVVHSTAFKWPPRRHLDNQYNCLTGFAALVLHSQSCHRGAGSVEETPNRRGGGARIWAVGHITRK